jgi:hypothetical protein
VILESRERFGRVREAAVSADQQLMMVYKCSRSMNMRRKPVTCDRTRHLSHRLVRESQH